jgi:hypothetical protein
MAHVQKSTTEDTQKITGTKMRKAGKIQIKQGSNFWNMIHKDDKDIEEAAAEAADHVRKELLDKAAKKAAEQKAYQDSIHYYDRISFAKPSQILRDKIIKCRDKYNEFETKQSIEWAKLEEFRKELQEKCLHEMALEIRTSYKDEYDQWHEGHYERKCIECFLVEESDYGVGDRLYSYGRKKYNKLEKAKVVELRETINGEEFQLEFEDLKW